MDPKSNTFQSDFVKEQEEWASSLRWEEPGAEGDPSTGSASRSGHHPMRSQLGAGVVVHFTILYYFGFASMACFLICLFLKILQALHNTHLLREILTALNC